MTITDLNECPTVFARATASVQAAPQTTVILCTLHAVQQPVRLHRWGAIQGSQNPMLKHQISVPSGKGDTPLLTHSSLPIWNVDTSFPNTRP